MTGCGSPVALQFSLTVELNDDTILEGGLDVNRGRDTTTNMVFFFQLFLEGFSLSRCTRPSLLCELVKFVVRCCCTSPSPRVSDRIIFSMSRLVWGIQSHDKLEEWKWFVLLREEVQGWEKCEAELKQEKGETYESYRTLFFAPAITMSLN